MSWKFWQGSGRPAVREIRISLDESQFRALCRGEIVQVQDRYTDSKPVKIALQDIGWERMYLALEDGVFDRQKKGREKKQT